MKNLFKSLAAFQQECPVIFKDNTAGSGNFSYKYADLPTIFNIVNPLLAKHGLGFTQMVNGTQLCTTVFHVATGETIEGCADIPQGIELKGMNAFQTLGSAITYMRRYQLSSMLGLVTDKDTDAQGQTVKRQQKQSTAKPTLEPNSEAWNKAKVFLADGGAISAIKKKYSISKENEEKLMDEVLG